MIKLNESDKKFFNDVWQKIDAKMIKVAKRSYDKIPYTAVDGVHDDKNDDANIQWWTNGFWGGMMWILYAQTKNEQYMKTAVNAENILRRVFTDMAEQLHHDVGFMWNISSGVHYRLTGDKKAKNDELLAAYSLASRYNIKGGFIRAWNDWDEIDHSGWAIIDCMMNIPLLYRATEMTGDKRFEYIARAHADKTMKYHIRPDGSSRHIVCYNTENGDFIEDFGGQGYELGSSWSRGQAWALYGFILSYIHTKDENYLNTAKKVANYFISCLSEEKDFLPLCDFRAPAEPVIYDSTAGACAACGLIEIANNVSEYEKPVYLNAAIKLLRAMTEKFVDFSVEKDPLVLYGTEDYRGGIHKPIIYGDYFYTEAVYKLINEKKDDILFW